MNEWSDFVGALGVLSNELLGWNALCFLRD